MIYRPSALVKIAIRWDEGAQTSMLDAAVLASNGALGVPANSATQTASALSNTGAALQDATEQLASLQQQIDDLTADRENMPPEEYTGLRTVLERERDALQQTVTQAGGVTPMVTPPDAVGAPPLDTLTDPPFQFQPLDVSLERNGRRTPDTAVVTLDFKDMPFDPRAVRAAAIEIIIGVVSAEEYALGIAGGRRDDGTLQSVVAPTTQGLFILGTGTRFVGVVDDWEIEYDGDDGDTVKLVCRDLTAIPADTPMVAGDGIDLDLPLDQGIRELFNRYPGTANTTVVWEGTNPFAPVPSVAVALPVTQRTRRGTSARRHQQSSGGNAGSMKLWDHVTDVCNQIGIVPTFNDEALVLSEPQRYNRRNPGTVKRMVYGRNLKKLGFKRKLGGVKVPTVEIRSFNASTGRCQWARYPTPLGAQATGEFGVGAPPIARLATQVPASGRPEERIEVLNLPGVTNPVTLLQAARSVWEQIGRQEIEGSMETDDISSFGVSFDEADLLNLRAGDEIEVLIASTQQTPPPSETPISATEIQALTFEGRVNYLMNLGFRRSVAQNVARLQTLVSDSSSFRTSSCRINFDNTEGLTIAIDFQNFIELRELRGQITSSIGVPSAVAEEGSLGLTITASQQVMAASTAQASQTEAIVQGRIEVPDTGAATFSADSPIDPTGQVDSTFGSPDFVEQQRRALLREGR
jgi:hypothetical protein